MRTNCVQGDPKRRQKARSPEGRVGPDCWEEVRSSSRRLQAQGSLLDYRHHTNKHPANKQKSKALEPQHPNSHALVCQQARCGYLLICWPTGPLGPGLQQQASSCTPGPGYAFQDTISSFQVPRFRFQATTSPSRFQLPAFRPPFQL